MEIIDQIKGSNGKTSISTKNLSDTRILETNVMTEIEGLFSLDSKNQSAPYYKTALGSAFLGNTLDLIKNVPDNSVSLIVTSPPYGLRDKKEYGNADPEVYVNWFMPFAEEFLRVLKPDGSFVLNIGGCWELGKPVRSLYHFELLHNLCKKFYLAQEFIWIKPAAIPSPAQWVTVKRIRVKDAFEYVWWFSKTPYPKADNRKILQPYTEAMKSLLKKGYVRKKRPSGYNITDGFA